MFADDDFKPFGFDKEKYEHRLGDWLKAEYVEPKYYYHIKSFKEVGYLNFYFKNNSIAVDGNDEFPVSVKTKFTESEYRELSERFGFDFDMFEREDID